MREPDWMFASVVVLGFIAIVLACVYESTYDARHCASDDARRAGVGSWYFSCLIAAVPVLFILTGSVTESFEFRDESVEVKESVPEHPLVRDSRHLGAHRDSAVAQRRTRGVGCHDPLRHRLHLGKHLRASVGDG